jgi:hypothetical protein
MLHKLKRLKIFNKTYLGAPHDGMNRCLSFATIGVGLLALASQRARSNNAAIPRAVFARRDNYHQMILEVGRILGPTYKHNNDK